jgi:MbtH protein
MTSPFEVPDDPYLVLANAEDQHCLWPAFADPPSSWRVAYGPAGRAACLEYISTQWTDIRPRSLLAHLAANGD